MPYVLLQLAHPILEALGKTSNKWIVDLLFVFNSGSLKQFEELRSCWSQQPDLVSNELFLRQKICLLALMEVNFFFLEAGPQQVPLLG